MVVNLYKCKSLQFNMYNIDILSKKTSSADIYSIFTYIVIYTFHMVRPIVCLVRLTMVSKLINCMFVFYIMSTF